MFLKCSGAMMERGEKEESQEKPAVFYLSRKPAVCGSGDVVLFKSVPENDRSFKHVGEVLVEGGGDKTYLG